jgi:hypothetical protein
LLPSLPSSVYQGPWTETDYNYTALDYKFSARFRYYIDFAKAFRGDIPQAAQIARILLGDDLGPNTVYQLIPWSWLVDWFTNLGAIVDNLTHDASDNLVADYAYINSKYYKYRALTLQFDLKNRPTSANSGAYTVTYEDNSTYFKRNKATPYGFGLTLAGLSGRQKAILGALGLTKLI